MSLKRRDFIRLSAGNAAGATMLSNTSWFVSKADKNLLLDKITPLTDNTEPISVKERQERVAKVQRLMNENKVAALVLDSGTSLEYFTGISWWPSERTMVAIIPAKGDIKYVSPAFEAERLRQLIKLGNDVRTWEEHESPYRQVANVFKDFDISNGTIGMEERLRYFVFDGIKKEAPQLNYINGDVVTMPCRLIKSPAELALMQKATDVTLAAYKVGIALLREGMTPDEFTEITAEAHKRLGASGGIDVNFGKASAYPHGSIEPQHLQKGDIVLMDGGCKVQGYSSDISRTIVFGDTPTKRQLEIWNLEKKAQAAGFAAAQLGSACQNVDAAARKVLVDAGFGPGYKLPGLPHRTGHGIGMDGHEWGNMVKGNMLPLQAGMCFSIEPNISIYGEFGVRLEDCAYMTDEGAKWFSQPSPSIDEPLKK